ncbi:Aspartyl/glutamyl-tRNA(Asn/Gln) amidotransferase subunit B [Candidatus Nasuia deltocephalinicola]|nr:Aspartyl/glutamyl-tRNA(Asn/Gln) amidotransferase subunit B [Candidatus Nasuia deltocephalinicola]
MKLKFEFLIGIESHIQLFCDKKLFSFIKIFNSNLNNDVSLLDLGLPGTLPVLNNFFLNKIILLGLFIKSDIYNISFFLRKNYFYPDISKNYQITQNNFSFIKNGYILIYNNYVLNSYYKIININRIHFEEDTAKIFYKNNISFLDYNRSGCVLLEIVSSYNISSIYESILYINNLRFFLKFLNISDCNMESSSFRFDVNFSLRKLNDFLPNYKIELKNLNSINSLFNVLRNEIKKLIYIYVNGFLITSQTIGYDSFLKSSFFIRKKEIFFDYRYFLDPDLFYIILKKKKIFFLLNRLFNWFYFYKFFIFKIKKNFSFSLFLLKKIFFFFLIFGFFYKNYIQLFNFFFIKNIFLNKNILLKNIFFSFEQIIILFNFYFYYYIDYNFLKKIFFFILKKNILFIFFLYKLIYFNLYKKISNCFSINLIINNYIFDNLFFIHNYIFNKNLFNNFLFFLLSSYNIDLNLLSIILKKKIFIYREMDEWFKSRN